MKVSERFEELRRILNEPPISISLEVVVRYQLTQLEVEIIKALQIARQEGYNAGQAEIEWEYADHNPDRC